MMTILGRSRQLAFAAIAAMSMLAAPSSLAAKADVELIKSFVGEWQGRAALQGGEGGTVSCRLSLSPGNQDKVNYAGRCSMSGTVVSVNGTLAYVEANRRFEAVMSSNMSFSGTAVGRKQGNTLVFNLKEREKDEKGNDLNVTAAIVLSSAKIDVDFEVVFARSGERIKATVPLTR